jgi:hypothetical protein
MAYFGTVQNFKPRWQEDFWDLLKQGARERWLGFGLGYTAANTVSRMIKACSRRTGFLGQ